MNRRGISPTVVMFLLCFLPLLLFYALALSGVTIDPLFGLVFLFVCWIAMFHMMSGAHEEKEHTASTREIPEELEGPLHSVETEDIFRSTRRVRAGNLLVAEGHLLNDPDRSYRLLKERFKGTGTTPLLQEDESGRSRLTLIPGEIERAPEDTRRIPATNLILFLLTLVATTWAGALHQGVKLLQEPDRVAVGLPYSLTLMAILGAHELGHYFAGRAHRMKVTLPYFIPVPFALGTFGAFIKLKSPSESRRGLFDVAVAGPLAGLVFAIPALWIGLGYSTVVETTGDVATLHHGASVGSSVLLAFLAKFTLGDAISQGHVLALHPLAFAGWLGLLVTALNLLPIGQLDGGHIADSMFGQRRSANLSTIALFALFMLGIFVWSGLLVWAFVAFFIAGSKGAPPLNDVSKLPPGRIAMGAFAFILLFLILVPVPHAFYKSLGIHCPYL